MAKQGSKSGKSNKTARVLSLLTDPETAEEPKDSAAEENEEITAASASTAKLADDRRTQAKIRGALEMELSGEAPARPSRSSGRSKSAKGSKSSASAAKPSPEETADPAPEPAPEPMPEPVPAPMPEPVPAPMPELDPELIAELAPESVPEPAPEPMPEPVFPLPTQPQESLQAAVAELRNAVETAPDEYICYNVTEALVEDKADKYIRMFGLCTCPRCRIDVIALALSNLPAKYVVAKPHELIPRLSIYEAKYNAAVVTQVMSACKKVLDRPHHVREKTQ